MTSDIKHLKPPTGKALVYIVRPSTFGFLLSFVITCDKKTVGVTKGKNFLYTILDPGTHLFESKSETATEMHLEVEAGKTYFIEQLMTFKVAKRRLVLVEENKGRRKLSGCTLSEPWEDDTTTVSGPSAVSPTSDPNTSNIKNMMPPAGKALVYLLRPTIDGFLLTYDILVDNVKLGSVKSKNFLYALLDPGTHLIEATSNEKSKWNMDVKVGEIAFLEIMIVAGIVKGRCKFNLLREKSGRKKLSRCKLSKTQMKV